MLKPLIHIRVNIETYFEKKAICLTVYSLEFIYFVIECSVLSIRHVKTHSVAKCYSLLEDSG
jgi:hypothetical protein